MLTILEHFDERPIVKMGTSMDQFSNTVALKDNETYGDLAVRIEQAAQRCKYCKLDIPDAINIRQFFVSSDWLKVKSKLDTLYPHAVKKRTHPA